MTPREAIARALARHVWENDEQFEHWVDTFAEDLLASGYVICKTLPPGLLVPPDRPNEPREEP